MYQAFFHAAPLLEIDGELSPVGTPWSPELVDLEKRRPAPSTFFRLTKVTVLAVALGSTSRVQRTASDDESGRTSGYRVTRRNSHG